MGISVKENMKDDTPVPTGVGFIVNTVSQKDLDSHSYWIHFLPSPPLPPTFLWNISSPLNKFLETLTLTLHSQGFRYERCGILFHNWEISYSGA